MNFSVRDLVNEMGAEAQKKVVILKNAMSPVNSPDGKKLAKGFRNFVENKNLKEIDVKDLIKANTLRDSS